MDSLFQWVQKQGLDLLIQLRNNLKNNPPYIRLKGPPKLRDILLIIKLNRFGDGIFLGTVHRLMFRVAIDSMMYFKGNLVLLVIISACSPSPSMRSAAQRNIVNFDLDGDNISGYNDQCPDEKETYNGLNDEDGCPDRSHSDGEATTLHHGRKVVGPHRPADCPVFRRLLSPAGNLEIWDIIFPIPGESSLEYLGTSNLQRVLKVIRVVPSAIEMWAENGLDEGADQQLGKNRLEAVRSFLLNNGIPPHKLLMATQVSADIFKIGRVRFGVVDKTLLRVTYFCYANQ